MALRPVGATGDSGSPDPVSLSADAVNVSELPTEVLPFLMANRYCETDLLSNFGSIKGGWAKVQAVCDYVNDRLTFGYPDARETRTAAQAMEERSGICRGSHALGDYLVPLPEYTGSLLQRIPWRYWRRT